MALLPRDPDAPLLRFDHLDELEGLIWKSEGARLAYLASKVPGDLAIVELGSYKGKSTAFLAAGAKAGDRPHVWAVDRWDVGGQQSPGRVKWGFDQPDTFARFEEQLRQARMWSQVTPIKGDTVTVGQLWTGPQVGLLFIDSFHDQDHIAEEIIAWTPHLAPGATVAFHDYGLEQYTVTEFVDGWVGDRPAVRYKRVVSVTV